MVSVPRVCELDGTLSVFTLGLSIFCPFWWVERIYSLRCINTPGLAAAAVAWALWRLRALDKVWSVLINGLHFAEPPSVSIKISSHCVVALRRFHITGASVTLAQHHSRSSHSHPVLWSSQCDSSLFLVLRIWWLAYSGYGDWQITKMPAPLALTV